MELNVAGYKWLWFDGYGKMTLGVAQALIRAGHQMYPFDIDDLDKPSWFLQARGLNFSHATVQLMPPDMMRSVPGRNFGWSMHESSILPDGWAEQVNQTCQWLLVPSPWLIEVFETAGVKVPIEVVPGGINPDECPILGQRHNRPYTFLALADRGNRKGYDKVWTAFYKAFPDSNQDVRLIIKCRPGSLERLDFSYGSDPRLTIWRADVQQMADVYAQADVYAAPARCEGYGMSQREAAACGIPSIIVPWSGTADDADKWGVPLNKYSLVESGMKGCGGLWAEPDTDELVWLMRDMYEHQDEYKARALVAAQWMRDNQTYAHAANKLVNVMGKWLGGYAPPVVAPTPTPDARQRLQEHLSAQGESRPVVVKSANGHAKAVMA